MTKPFLCGIFPVTFFREETMNCPRCGHAITVKNGQAKGKPRRKCKACGHQFTRTAPAGKPVARKALAIVLYLSGLSLRRIGTICGVSRQAVLNWVRDYALKHAKKPDPQGETVVLELDEMWHFLEKKEKNSGSGKLWIAQPVDSWIGSVETAASILCGDLPPDWKDTR